MKKAGLFFMSILLLLGFTSCVSMEDTRSASQPQAMGTYKGSVPFIFVERDVEFAIYPTGEFDFAYVGPNYRYTPYNGPRRPFSYNGGYNYDVYLQFDRFGAVIQVESVPIFYDYYGRIIQAGNVILRYSGDYVTQIGNMHIIYERGGVYLASSGYVNNYNQHLRPQPWHPYYTRPYYPIVYATPYREHYKPKRYSYDEHRQRYDNRGRSNYDNGRRTFIDPGTHQPRREGTTDNRRENIQNPTDSNRGRNNTTNPRGENTKEATKGRRGSSTIPTENTNRRETTKRGESSANQKNTKRRETTQPTNDTTSKRGDSSAESKGNNRKSSVTPTNNSNPRRGTSSTQENESRRQSNSTDTRRGSSSNNQTSNSRR